MSTPARFSSLKWLATAVIRESALKRGDEIIDFCLPDGNGKNVKLFNLLEEGPVVLQFFRGGWCPHCASDLLTLERILPDIKALGSSLIGISPQRVEFSHSTSVELGLTFPLLTDFGNVVAKRFGVVYKLAHEIVEDMEAAGIDLLLANGEAGRSELPIPSTYIIDSQKLIRLALIQEEWTSRLDPEVVLEELRAFWEAD